MPDDYEGPVTLRLVRHGPSAANPRGALLWIHGFADYFFHRHVAESFAASGFAFYAVDLRRFGRSLEPHQTPNFCRDVSEYYPDLDTVLDVITRLDGHGRVIPLAHSTGGLVVPLWHARLPAERQAQVPAMILNSPFFALPVDAPNRVMKAVSRTIVRGLAAAAPFREVPRSGVRLYGPSLHRGSYGEWDYDLTWKPHDSFPVRSAWLAAVVRAQEKVARQPVQAPTLVLTAERSLRLSGWVDQAMEADVVLDVDKIRAAADRLGPLVTQVPVAGALHDVTLSAGPAREQAFTAMITWLDETLGSPP